MAKQKSSATRRSILDSATKVFAKTGFYKAKAVDIAQEADVAVGTIYNYFKNKDDILISIFEERIGELNRSLREAIRQTDDPDEKLAVILDSTISLLQNDRDLAEVVTIELRQSSKFFSSTAISSVIEFLDLITGVVKQGQRKRVFRSDVDARVVALTLLGTLENLLHVWVLGARVPEMRAKYNISLDAGIADLKKVVKEGLHCASS